MRPQSKPRTILFAVTAAGLTLTGCSSPESSTAERFVAAAIAGESTLQYVSLSGYVNQDAELERDRAGCTVTGSSPVEGTGNAVAPQRVELDCQDGEHSVTVDLNAEGKVYGFDW
jgi:hypothetical protein